MQHHWIDKLINLLSSQSIIHVLTTGSPIDIGIGSMLLFTSAMWCLSYQIGLFLNLQYSKIGWPKGSFSFRNPCLMPCSRIS